MLTPTAYLIAECDGQFASIIGHLRHPFLISPTKFKNLLI
jgi:hypothetical protein